MAIDEEEGPEDAAVYVEGLPPVVAPPRRRRAGLLTAGLVAALVAAVAFFAGVRIEKSRVSTTGAAGSFARLLGQTGVARQRGAGGAAGAFAGGGGGGGGGAGATVGQVKLVDGTTIYVSDAQGGITKVTTGPGSTFTKTSQASITDIRPGDTVVVQGAGQPDGTVSATRVVDNGAGGAGG